MYVKDWKWLYANNTNLFCHVRVTHTPWVWDRVGLKLLSMGLTLTSEGLTGFWLCESLDTILPVSGWITGHLHKNIFEHEQYIISVSLLQVVFLYGRCNCKSSQWQVPSCKVLIVMESFIKCTLREVASHADVLRGSSRVPAPRRKERKGIYLSVQQTFVGQERVTNP